MISSPPAAIVVEVWMMVLSSATLGRCEHARESVVARFIESPVLSNDRITKESGLCT